MLSGSIDYMHKQTKHWDQVYKNITFIDNINAKDEKYQINLFIPIKLYDEYINNIEHLLQNAINDEIILSYKKIGGSRIYNTETMLDSVKRSYDRNEDQCLIDNKLIDYNNPVIIYPANRLNNGLTEELANLCIALERMLKSIQEENKFLSLADLHLTDHLSFRRISLYEEHVDISILSSQQLKLLKKLASKSYLFEQLEDYIYVNRKIQKYINQLRNSIVEFNRQDKNTLKKLKNKLDNLENDMMNLSEDDMINLTENELKELLEELRIIAMEQDVVNTYEVMREENFLGMSHAADLLEAIINSSDKMGLPDKYGETCRVPHDPTSSIMPLICKRYVSNGKIFFNLKAMQNENFMTESMRLIIDRIDRKDFENKFKFTINSDEYIEACFTYYFSDVRSSSNQKVNCLKIYSFHEDDALSNHSEKDKFRMQMIIYDLITQQILGSQTASILLNVNDMEKNKKHYPFTYAYQQLKIRLSRIKTHRPQLNSLMEAMEEYNKLIYENEKFELLKAKIYQVRVELKNQVRAEALFFKCCAQSNLVDALRKFENEVINDMGSFQLNKNDLKLVLKI